ncbi:MAG: TolC family protein [Thermovirgaceae bacterium]|nr:TolC family protein [Thermovirgaceae bacterium]
MSRRAILALSILLLSLFVLTLGRRAWAEPGGDLSVEAAVSLAMENNPQIKIAEKRVEQAKARSRGASASKAPTLTASALYQETWMEPRYPVYLAGGVPAGEYALAGYRETWKTALTLTWLLYSSGSVENSIRAANLALEAVRAESARVEQGVAHAAKRAFYELQRARARATVAEEALSLALEHLRQVEALYRNGIVAKNEVLRVKVAVSEAELNLIRAKNGIDVAFSALERATGTTIKGSYSLPDPAMNPGQVEIPDNPAQTALSIRPELKALEFSGRSARAAAAAAAGEKGPSLYIQGDAFSAGQEFYPDAVDDWKIIAVAEWKLYDGGRSRARKDEALAVAGELLQRIEDMKRQVELEVSVSMLDLRSALQRLDVAAAQVAFAEEDHRMAVARYAAQVGTNIDALDARVALSNSKTQLVDAVYDALCADSDVRFAMGIDPEILKSKR